MNLRSSIVTCLALAAVASTGCSMETYGEEVAVATEPLLAQGQFQYPQFPSKESNIVSRGNDCLDLFTLTSNGTIDHRTWNGTGWSAVVNLGAPSGLPFNSFASVVNGTRLDLFGVTSNGTIYRKNATASQGCGTGMFWTAWTQIAGATATVTSARDRIAAASWGPGRLDVVWLMSSGNLGHAWSDNGGGDWGTENGDTNAALHAPPEGPFLPPIEAVSTRGVRLDILSSNLVHVWYDGFPPKCPTCPSGGGWGTGPSLHRKVYRLKGGQYDITIDMTIAKTGSGKFELFGLHRHTLLGTPDYDYRMGVVNFDATTGWSSITGTDIFLTTILNQNGTVPLILPGRAAIPSMNFNSAFRWNGPVDRSDVFGTLNNQDAYQIWMQ